MSNQENTHSHARTHMHLTAHTDKIPSKYIFLYLSAFFFFKSLCSFNFSLNDDKTELCLSLIKKAPMFSKLFIDHYHVSAIENIEYSVSKPGRLFNYCHK